MGVGAIAELTHYSCLAPYQHVVQIWLTRSARLALGSSREGIRDGLDDLVFQGL